MKKRHFTGLALLYGPPILISVFSLFYLLNDHAGLTRFYLGLNDTFYRSEHWGDFFTAGVKAGGDLWCAAALIVSTAWIALMRKEPMRSGINASILRDKALIAIIPAAIAAALVMHYHSAPAADEVFSALNFASLPSLQCATYYVLPNNHILFNLISGMVRPLFEDPLMAARSVSMLAYVLTLYAAWDWLRDYLENNMARAAALLVLMFQFSAWGFSAQGRGYELMIFFSLVSLKGLLRYLRSSETAYLFRYLFSVAAGMFIVPSFLLWGAGLGLMALLSMVIRRRYDATLVRYTAAAWMLVFLLYVPVLSFSGISAISDNPYVKGYEGSHLDFIPVFFGHYGYFSGLYQEWFVLGIGGAFLMLLLPLLSGLVRRPDARFAELLLVYVVFAAGFAIVSVFLKNFPFYRNLSAHAALVHVVILVAVLRFARTRIPALIISLVFTVYAGAEVVKNYARTHTCLYYYDVTSTRRDLSACAPSIERGDKVFIDNEAFYWWAMLRDSHPGLKPDLNRRNFHGQDVCILHRKEDFLRDSASYKMTDTCVDYVYYRKQRQFR